MTELRQLLRELEAEARRAPFPLDLEAYRRAGRDPHVPILYAGNLDASVCSLGRDLGRDEVRHGQPQVGAAGRLVRQGVLEALGLAAPPTDPLLETALRYVLLTNIVPYKPPGNRAYPPRVRERFRPYIARFLAFHWKGNLVLTLGTEAFMWFAPYAAPGEAEAFWRREDRYEAEFACVLEAEEAGETARKPLTLGPLPHPSPLNQRWFPLFPELLRRRLERWLRGRPPGAP